MARTIHPHGSRTRYRHGPDEHGTEGRGCRCRLCTDAAAKSVNLFRLRVAEVGHRKVDTAPVREHIQQLNRAGLAYKTIAELAGVKIAVIDRLLYGLPAQNVPPSRRMYRENAEAILAVHSHQLGGKYTLAVGTRRRLQSLALAGWPTTHIAARAGMNPDYLGRVMRDKVGLTVTVETRQKIAEVFRQLRNADPLAAGVNPLRVAQVRRAAIRRGYAPWAAWDDIDNPDDSPRGVRREDVS